MSKLLILVVIFINYIGSSFSKETQYLSSCTWENRTETPCIEITGKISNQSNLSKSGINKYVITRKEIEQIGAVDIIDVLKSVPDINITQSGPKGQQASLFMRGTGSNHTLVMINGIPINDQSTTQGLHDFGVDFIQTVQQIEIYPGSSASNFGTNAIGGAINIILAGDLKDSISLTTDKNTNYEFYGNKSFLYPNSTLNLKLGGVENKTISARGNRNGEKDEVKNYTFNVNYENFIENNLRFHTTTYFRKTKSEYDNSVNNQTGYLGDNRMGTIQLGVEKKYQNRISDYILYYNKYDRKYNERGTIDSYESEVVGLKYDLSKKISDKFSLGAGSEYKYDWGYFDNNGSYEASTKGNSNNFAVFTNFGWNFAKKSNLSIFARSDYHKYTHLNSTYKLNLEQSFGNSKLGISYMTGLRNPTLYELFGTDNFGYSGNRSLQAEKSNTYEVYSTIQLNEKISIILRGFRSNVENNIEYISNKYQNDKDNINLNQSGFNNQLNYKADNIDFNFHASLLSSKKENGSSQLRRPTKNYGFSLFKKNYNDLFGNYNINILYNHYGKHFDTHSSNFSTIEMDSTDIVDLKIMKKIYNNDWYLKVDNLLKENYQRPHGYNQDGRILKVGYKF